MLEWPGHVAEIPVAVCLCTFCAKHGAGWTSHRSAEFDAAVSAEPMFERYRFGTRSADFYVCSLCGAVPFVISEIEGHLYAVVNVNTFEEVETLLFVRSVTNFDGEDTQSRLGRRKDNWIRSVRISIPGGE